MGSELTRNGRIAPPPPLFLFQKVEIALNGHRELKILQGSYLSGLAPHFQIQSTVPAVNIIKCRLNS
jgi:hypothetical protein